MYIGCGRLSIIITEGQMRIFLMTPVGVVVTTRGRERVKEIVKNPVVKVEENMDSALSRLSSMSERESVATT